MLDREKIKKWYDCGSWSDEMVGNAVAKGKLTAEDYLYITGEEYPDTEAVNG